jgi:hypothetical protein
MLEESDTHPTPIESPLLIFFFFLTKWVGYYFILYFWTKKALRLMSPKIKTIGY